MCSYWVHICLIFWGLLNTMKFEPPRYKTYYYNSCSYRNSNWDKRTARCRLVCTKFDGQHLQLILASWRHSDWGLNLPTLNLDAIQWMEHLWNFYKYLKKTYGNTQKSKKELEAIRRKRSTIGHKCLGNRQTATNGTETSKTVWILWREGTYHGRMVWTKEKSVQMWGADKQLLWSARPTRHPPTHDCWLDADTPCTQAEPG